MEITLTGKVAVVTGAASGIGLAITRSYLECDAAGVVAVDRQDFPPALEQMQSRYRDRLRLVSGDVGRESTAIEMVETALGAFGRVDILVANAGVSIIKPVHEHTPEEWDAVFNTNVKAVYWAARHVMPVMIHQGSGLILMTGSISGERGIPTQGAYAPSKAALHQMTRQMAVEYAKHGIRVNSIACGTVDTPIVYRSAEASGDPDAYWNMLRSNHPSGALRAPKRWARFSPTWPAIAPFLTGSVLMMDGGYMAK